MMKLQVLAILVLMRMSSQQQYTFPMSYGFPQVHADRFAYTASPPVQQNPRFTFNPMTRIQVQPPMSQYGLGNQGGSSHYGLGNQASSPYGLGSDSAYQVDQRPPTPPPATDGPIRLIPPFLKGASMIEQDKFYAIVQHPTWSGAEKNQRIEELMRTMSEERQEEYSDYRNTVHGDLERRRKSVDTAVKSMSPEAFEQFQKVVEIMRDVSMAENLKMEKLEKIYSRLPDSIRREFDEKLKGF